jgi:hypothetical protein
MTKYSHLQIAFLLFGTLLSFTASAQTQSPHPKNYFQFPIKPGQVNTLSGNMGEIRPNHFHAGLDIRTDQREGLPVYASAEGYIYRVKVSSFGYGNIIYVRHPNGYTTLYAHLQRFMPELADYVRLNQYTTESFEIDLYPEKGDFPVKKGQVIAYSGNTGGSGGPHLHFEIRDTSDNVLNPLLFGFSEIKDNIPPVFTKLAVKALDIDARVNGEFGKVIKTPIKQGTTYALAQPVEASGLIGIEIEAHDLLDGASFKKGVNCVEVKVDGKEIYYHKIDNLNYNELGHINVHKDFADFRRWGHKLQRCYIADGNQLQFYRSNTRNGKFMVQPNKTHKVEVVIWDVYRNSSTLRFDINGQAPEPLEATATIVPAKNEVLIKDELIDNTLKISTTAPAGLPARLFTQKRPVPLEPAYKKGTELVYLWDMRKGLPDSIDIGGATYPFTFRKAVAPGRKATIQWQDITVDIPEKALFDTLYASIDQQEGIYDIHTFTEPVQVPLEMKIKVPARPADAERTHAYRVQGKSLSFVGGAWNGNEISFKTKNLGRHTLATDKTPPTVKIVSATPKQVRVSISDGMSGIQSFRATLNGEWLLMNYDHKLRMIWSEQLDSRVPLNGDFELTVKDNAGNVSIVKATIKEGAAAPAQKPAAKPAAKKKPTKK